MSVEKRQMFDDKVSGSARRARQSSKLCSDFRRFWCGSLVSKTQPIATACLVVGAGTFSLCPENIVSIGLRVEEMSYQGFSFQLAVSRKVFSFLSWTCVGAGIYTDFFNNVFKIFDFQDHWCFVCFLPRGAPIVLSWWTWPLPTLQIRTMNCIYIQNPESRT